MILFVNEDKKYFQEILDQIKTALPKTEPKLKTIDSFSKAEKIINNPKNKIHLLIIDTRLIDPFQNTQKAIDWYKKAKFKKAKLPILLISTLTEKSITVDLKKFLEKDFNNKKDSFILGGVGKTENLKKIIKKFIN